MKQIVVLSGKGGTGKTSVVAALASIMPSLVLADCDVDAADLHLIAQPKIVDRHDFVSGEFARIDGHCTGCLTCFEKCRFGAITDEPRIHEDRCEGCGLCAFVCPEQAIVMEPCHCGWWYESHTRFGIMVHASLKAGAENSGRLVTTVRRRANELAEEQGCEYVLVDGSPGIGCPVIASLTGVDLALLVAEPSASALHDLKRVRELASHFHIPCAALINKFDLSQERTREILDFCARHDVPVAGKIPYDPVFTQAQLAGQSAVEFAHDVEGPRFGRIWETMRALLGRSLVRL